MMSEEPTRISSFLKTYFHSEFYEEAIRSIKADLAHSPTFAAEWVRMTEIIQNRGLASGEALYLVHNAANQVLDENSEEEAYVWLDKMVENINRDDGVIEPY